MSTTKEQSIADPPPTAPIVPPAHRTCACGVQCITPCNFTPGWECADRRCHRDAPAHPPRAKGEACRNYSPYSAVDDECYTCGGTPQSHAPPVDRSRCAAWCGHSLGDGDVNTLSSAQKLGYCLGTVYTSDGSHVHCSDTCRDNRVPPLAATPEAIATQEPPPKICRSCFSAPCKNLTGCQPAAKAAEPVLCRCATGSLFLLGHGRDVFEHYAGEYCIPSKLPYTAVLRDKARPDLIDRRMLRDEGVESDCWETVR